MLGLSDKTGPPSKSVSGPPCSELSCAYSAGGVTRSEHKVSKPSKGEIGGIGIRTPRVGGQGGMGGISGKIGEICKNTKGRGNRGMAPWAPQGKNTEGPSKKLGSSLDCALTVVTDTKNGVTQTGVLYFIASTRRNPKP